MQLFSLTRIVNIHFNRTLPPSPHDLFAKQWQRKSPVSHQPLPVWASHTSAPWQRGRPGGQAGVSTASRDSSYSAPLPNPACPGHWSPGGPSPWTGPGNHIVYMALYYDDGHRVQVSSHHGHALVIITLCSWYYDESHKVYMVFGIMMAATKCTW